MRGDMDILKINNNKILWAGTWGIIILSLFAGCSGKFGSYKRDAVVKQAFESNQVPAEYKYFYYGFDTRPYAIFGVETKYEMDSRMWKEATPDTSEFQEMTRWIWEDYGYYKFGADILDPNGNKVGVLYTAINETTIKFHGDNQISVIPSTPFLGGPDANGGVRAR
jgi:hypothetical protein